MRPYSTKPKGLAFKPQKVKRPASVAYQAQSAYNSKPTKPVQSVAQNPVGRPPYPASPAPTVSPPAGPQAQAPPFDAAYEGQVSSSQQRYGNTIADIAFQRTQAGYQWNDPSNPFNAAAMLQKAYTQRNSGIGNSYAAAGQLYSGATQRNLDESRFGYEQSYDQGQQAYANQLHGLSSAEAAALLDRNDAQGAAYQDWLARAPRPDDPGPPAPAAVAGAPASTANPTVKGLPFKPQQVPRQGPKGQPFKPKKVPRKKGKR